jgi:hypothetical protein
VDSAVYQRATELLEASIGDELVALNTDAGTCFGFNEVATTVWRALEQPRTVAELQAALVAEYDVGPEQCEAELKELLDDMSDRGLVCRQ